MARVIFKKDLPELLLSLNEVVVAPVKEAHHPSYDACIFKEFEKGDLLELPYGTSILPPKEYLLPPKETLFQYFKQTTKQPQPKETLIFGVNLEDLEAIRRLDVIFKEPIIDTPYERRRSKITIVAVDNFSVPENINCDLYLMWLNNELLAAFPKTKKGRQLTSSKLFQNHQISIPKVRQNKDLLLENSKLSKVVESSKNHPIWEELAQKCFGCGICSYSCPLCYCFEVEDDIAGLGKDSGERCRTWDSCLLSHFSETTTGNFRPELKDRIYNWYFHKFVRMPKEVGFNGCVGCNRCSIYCPAKINYRKVLEKLIFDYEKKEKGLERSQLRTTNR